MTVSKRPDSRAESTAANQDVADLSSCICKHAGKYRGIRSAGRLPDRWRQASQDSPDWNSCEPSGTRGRPARSRDLVAATPLSQWKPCLPSSFSGPRRGRAERGQYLAGQGCDMHRDSALVGLESPKQARIRKRPCGRHAARAEGFASGQARRAATFFVRFPQLEAAR